MYLTKLLGAKQNVITSIREGWIAHGRGSFHVRGL